MTDLEITRLCAEAMGITFKVDIGPPRMKGARLIEAEIESAKKEAYAPLHDDAQAMALVKKLYLRIFRSVDDCWIVESGDESLVFGKNIDLNRAICECAAKMQQAKAIRA